LRRANPGYKLTYISINPAPGSHEIGSIPSTLKKTPSLSIS